MLFDVTRVLCEQAAWRPYDKSTADCSKTSWYRPGHGNRAMPDLPPDIDHMRAEQRKARAPGGPLTIRDMGFLKTAAIEDLGLLRETGGDYARFLSPALEARISELPTDRKFFRRWSSRIANLADIAGS